MIRRLISAISWDYVLLVTCVMAVVLIIRAGMFFSYIPPVQDLVDEGTYSFAPTRIERHRVQRRPCSCQNTSRCKHSYIAYTLYYRGGGYGWQQQFRSSVAAEEEKEKGAVTMQVFSIPSEDSYVVADPQDTPESYTRTRQWQALLPGGLALIYLVGCGGFLLVRHMKRQRAAERT